MESPEAWVLWTRQGRPAPRSLKRYPTGLAQSVFEVVTDQGTVVWRVSSPATAPLMAAAAGWLPRLAAAGLPVPRILEDLTGLEPSSLVLEHIPGQDLGLVYDDLPPGRRRSLARQVAGLDALVKTLGPGRGYGFLARSDDPGALGSWEAVVRAHLERSRGRLVQAGLFDPGLADRALALVPSLSEAFDRVEPLPFLDDATTKNVLIDGGRLAWIVDFDWLGHGDRWFAPALTGVSLLAAGRDPDYVDAWIEAWSPGPEELRSYLFYRLAFCLDFLSEMGTTFNRDRPEPVDPAAAGRLRGAAGDLLAAFEAET